MTGGSIARRARGCIGARFRSQGRDPAIGLDCVGVVAVAYAGRLRVPPPVDYAQRGGDARTIKVAIERAGLRPVDPDDASEGDVLLLATGPGQWHLAVLTASGFVHADAGLRRVTETPGRPHWPVRGAWRLIEGET